ncbi:SHOCT domain-containing protein [Occultella kanbiaonis]|uniref:SHOCT domain-containing protein n=1 Tax=Occultella kanbiaonis TaxID=2675754 RepID=UPI0013D66A92|nr:SHOCT domain-containing protein [Occultella kanbiaonis]
MRLQLWHVLVLLIMVAIAAVLVVIVFAAVRSSRRPGPPTVGPGPQGSGSYPSSGSQPYAGTYGGRPASPGADGPPSSPGAIDPEKRVAALRELAQMRKDGLLTEDEYQAEVRRLG